MSITTRLLSKVYCTLQVIYNNNDVTGSVKNKASLAPAPGTSTLLEIPLATPTASGKLN